MSCKAICRIYSGRRDPEWVLSDRQIKEVEKIWDGLEETDDREEFPSFLGYRGIGIVCESKREYFVYNGRARGVIENKIIWKSDEAGRLEKFLLSTAPEGILPADLLNNLL